MCSERDVADELFTHHLAPEQNKLRNDVQNEVQNKVVNKVVNEVLNEDENKGENAVANKVPSNVQNKVVPHDNEATSDQTNNGTDFKYIVACTRL